MVINRMAYYISRGRVEVGNTVSFVANLLQYLCAKNYQNTKRFDEVIAKEEWCNFLPHSVLGRSTVSGFDLAWFSSLSSERLCVFGTWCYIYFAYFFLFTF